ncbi:uncharacterized protein LOC142983951 [Anticarsia gemmatalis]|uniref:uncharacterized protein LOC142983951 n=1 Tax=Anticarsia gemmatalis TaxID=129554 RepID=UPI003F771FD6
MFHEKLDVKLIRLVKENPVLYDFNNEKYMDFNAREVAWQKIGDELRRPATDCKLRWINIRDVHRRIIRKTLETGKRVGRMYKYEGELVFMRSFYKDVTAPTPSFDEDMDKTGDWNVVICQENEQDVQAQNSDDSDKPVKRSKAKKRKVKKRTESCEAEEQQPPSTSFNEVQTPTELDVTDPVDAFLLSIGATLKTFSAYHLNIAKSKIFAVVQEHDLQQIVQNERQENVDVKTSATDTMYTINTM